MFVTKKKKHLEILANEKARKKKLIHRIVSSLQKKHTKEINVFKDKAKREKQALQRKVSSYASKEEVRLENIKSLTDQANKLEKLLVAEKETSRLLAAERENFRKECLRQGAELLGIAKKREEEAAKAIANALAAKQAAEENMQCVEYYRERNNLLEAKLRGVN
jgi:hypothetical protein